MSTSTQQTKVLAELSPAKKGALTKLIKKNNQLYEQATKKERKILILKDALNVLKANKLFELDFGTYLESEQNLNINQSTLLTSDDKICSVCARGALFLSKVRLSNNFNGEYISNFGSVKSVEKGCNIFHNMDGFATILKDAFTVNELSLIEACYEADRKYLTVDLETYIHKFKEYKNQTNTLQELIKITFKGSPEGNFRKIASIIIDAKGEVIRPLLKVILQ